MLIIVVVTAIDTCKWYLQQAITLTVYNIMGMYVCIINEFNSLSHTKNFNKNKYPSFQYAL